MLKSIFEDGTPLIILDKNTDYFYRVQNPKFTYRLRQICENTKLNPLTDDDF